jgi:hypothetical protein
MKTWRPLSNELYVTLSGFCFALDRDASMPIVITDDQMKEAMDVLEASIAAVAEKKEPIAQMA